MRKNRGAEKSQVVDRPKKTAGVASKESLLSAKRAEEAAAALQTSQLPAELQQLSLNIFKNAFPDLSDDEPTKKTLQEVKQALFERDFARAFGKQEYLEAYAFRWSPSRALGYTNVLWDLRVHFKGTGLCGSERIENSADGEADEEYHVACLGGGAAEVVAIGGFLNHLRKSQSRGTQGKDENVKDEQVKDEQPLEKELEALTVSNEPPSERVNVLLIDSADWDEVAHKLSEGLITPPPLSKYANAAARAANTSLLPAGSLKTTFHQADLLDLEKGLLTAMLGQRPLLVTLLFTLNELYTASISKTTAFLLKLTEVVQKGTMLLVVDSPGSYSEATLGKESKKYPMQWLMDMTLTGNGKQERGKEEEEVKWEKLVSDESRWFRLQESLKYPIPLENMRCQVHLFRRL